MKKILAIYLLITVTFIGGLYYLFANGIFWFHYPSYKFFPTRGLDISHHQGIIDWNKLKTQQDKFKFIYIKATEGADFIDSQFADNWNNARQNGFIFGAYHYFTLKSSGIDQANNFIRTVPYDSTALHHAVDLEFGGNSTIRPSKDTLLKELHDFLITVERHYKKKPILYVTYQFYDHYLKGSYVEYYQIWIRDIYKHPRLSTHQDWLFWQYHSRARVKGIHGFVDQNIFKGSYQELVTWKDLKSQLE